MAVDNNLDTWDAYNNEYWPAEYLIDPTGIVRAYGFGEGGYSQMESNIRMLLSANGVAKPAGPHRRARQDARRATRITPESYVGYEQTRQRGRHPGPARPGGHLQRPVEHPSNSLAFSGTWNVHSQEATAGAKASLDLQFTADDVYLVMGGTAR